MKKCGKCSFLNTDEAKFCCHCGASFDEPRLVYSDSPVPACPLPVKRRRDGRLISFLKAVAYVILFFVLQIAVTFVFSVTISAFVTAANPGMPINELTELIAETYSSYVNIIQIVFSLLYIGVLSVFFIARHKKPMEEMGFVKCSLKSIAAGFVFGFFSNIVITVVISLIPLPESMLSDFEGQYGSIGADGNVFLTIFAIAVLTGFVEEITFRSLAVSRLSRRFRNVGCTVISAAIFGVMHFTPIAIFYAFIFGLLLAPIYIKYKSVLPTAAAHIGFNIVGVTGIPADEPLLFLALVALSCAVTLLSYYLLIRRSPDLEKIKL